MASEDLFQNDYTEEQNLEQDSHKDREMYVNTTGDTNGNGITTEKSDTAKSATVAVVEQNKTNNENKAPEHEHDAKLTQLPMARIRNIMKLDPDLQIATNEAVFAVTRAVELFIESLSRESYTYTAQAKKKTIQKRDVDLAISAVDSLMFLDGAMNF